jgi:hypothetical protein
LFRAGKTANMNADLKEMYERLSGGILSSNSTASKPSKSVNPLKKTAGRGESSE